MAYDHKIAAASDVLLTTDVLIVGGGPAAAWAALSAAESGAKVILADKGFFGTSGATAPSNTGTWCVPPGEGRTTAVEHRFKRTAGLADKRWMMQCADRSYENLQKLVEWGYPFPHDDGGNLYVANLRGPDYMRFMRKRVQAAGVKILDHHPVLELLGDERQVFGAAGLSRRSGANFQIRAGAVVLATGGCAFFERILGGTGLTGDGYLFAVEAGAALSGMEFTGKYTLAPYGSSLNKGLPFRWATFYLENGEPLRDADGMPASNGIGPGERLVARALIDGPVYARLDLAEPVMQDWLRRGQPNCFMPYDRMGIDPFRDLFRVELKFEGTVRGTGGIRIVSSECGTGVPGLFASGDAASRENVTGGISGGGAINASWAIASGWWPARAPPAMPSASGSASRNTLLASAPRDFGRGAPAGRLTSAGSSRPCGARSCRCRAITGVRKRVFWKAVKRLMPPGKRSPRISHLLDSIGSRRGRLPRSPHPRAGPSLPRCCAPKAAGCIGAATTHRRIRRRPTGSPSVVLMW